MTFGSRCLRSIWKTYFSFASWAFVDLSIQSEVVASHQPLVTNLLRLHFVCKDSRSHHPPLLLSSLGSLYLDRLHRRLTFSYVVVRQVRLLRRQSPHHAILQALTWPLLLQLLAHYHSHHLLYPIEYGLVLLNHPHLLYLDNSAS